MKSAIGQAVFGVSLTAALTFCLVACESEFNSDRGRPVTRAVQNPTNHNDAMGEELAGTQEGVPLVTVDFPNREGQPMRVRTIGDNVRETLNPPTTTAPANVSTPGEPNPRPPTHIEVNPLTGESQ